jgi:hypothetical protein
MFFLGIESGSPTFNGYKSTLIFDVHDNAHKLLWLFVVWTIFITVQLIYCIIRFFVGIPDIIFMLFWFIVGIFLFQTKTLAIGVVWNFWMFCWTGGDEQRTKALIDVAFFNESVFNEFIIEALPQLVIQSINNNRTGTFSPIAVFSIAFSGYLIFNGLVRY